MDSKKRGTSAAPAAELSEQRAESHEGKSGKTPEAEAGQSEASSATPQFPVAEIEVPSDIGESQAARFREITAILIKNDLVHGLTPQKVRQTIEDLGPTFVKIGQVMSTRPDMIPKEYCKELAQLRTDVAPMTRDELYQQLTATYGDHLKSIFSQIDEEPIGSASIAQANTAILKTGEKVVLKVQRPGIYETMSEDIALLRRGARALQLAAVSSPVNFVTMLDELWEVTQEEMDFLVEAHNNERFTELNKGEERITCPHIYDQWTTSKILVMEYIDGISVGQVEKLDAAGYNREDLANLLVSNYIKQVIEDGFFHADPHAGNIWVRGGDIVWIDMGMMGHLTGKERKGVTQAIMAVVNHDVSSLKEVVLALGVYSGDINHPKLYGDIDTFLTKYGSMDLEGLDIEAAVTELVDLARGNGIQMPSSMSMFARGVATLEGTVTDLCPTVSLASIMGESVEHSVMDNFDVKGFVGDKARKLYNSTSKAVEMPGLATDLLKMTLRGRTRVNMHMEFSDTFRDSLNEWVNRFVAGLIVSAFLIGSSFLCTTGMDPKILGVPALGVIGFMVAVILALGVLYDSRRNREKGKSGFFRKRH